MRNTSGPRSNGKTRTAGEALTETAQRYMEEHYREKFSLSRIADALYVNGSYLLRTFRAQTGQTMLWYHNHVRCEKASEMLANTRKTISDISEEVGFTTTSHFSHVYRRMTGISPTEYRARQQAAGRK